MTYATEHAGALDQITDAGVAVTFTRTAQGDYDPEADTMTPSDSTVTGYAIRVKGLRSDEPGSYRSLGLVEAKAATLLFAPTTYGETPSVGDTVTWDGATHTVRYVEPVAPDGTTIIARVVVER